MLQYQSTRGLERNVSASAAIVSGIAKDGGLYVPSEFPHLPKSIKEYASMSYQDLAKEIMALYFTDFSAEEIEACVKKAYGEQFDTPEIAPVKKHGKYYFLELFHGPTYAFKDMALQILPHLMTVAMKKQGIDKQVLILTATSGDTGKAAMEGFADVNKTQIIVFYPKDGVSFIQEYQMCTQTGNNLAVMGIEGNFDDAQNGVKQLFADNDFLEKLSEQGLLVSSANSINIGRLIPQVVYYIYAYTRLLKQGELQDGELLDVVVPTGNFGNILAAYYARKMGLPIGVLLSASNENKVIADFMKENVYDRNRAMHLTKSPSMDILISSNLERLLYDIAETEKVKTYMEQLQEQGKYQIEPQQRQAMGDFYGEYADEEEVSRSIKAMFDKENYLIDTHTAVAVAVAEKVDCLRHKTLVVSTANPYKFASSVLEALGEVEVKEGFELAEQLFAKTAVEIPAGIAGLSQMERRFSKTIAKEEMKEAVLGWVMQNLGGNGKNNKI